MSDKKMNIHQKLHHIQKQIVGLGEDKKSFGYKYVSGSKVLSHVKPLMNDLGLLLKQEILDIDNTRQDYKTKNGEKSEVLTKVKMKFTWVDVDSGETDENLFAANGQNDWEKGLGSALTYGERYFLLKYFHISTDKDDIDNPDRKQDDAPQKKIKKPEKNKQAVGSMDGLIKSLESNKDKTLKAITSNRFLSASQFEDLKGTGLLNEDELKGIEVR